MQGNTRRTQSADPQAHPAAAPPICDPLDAMESLATTVQYRRGQEIYAQEDPAEYWYRVVRGTVRKCAIKADGRRQIVDFLLPGDLFGLNTRREHRFAVEAVTDGTVVARYPRRKIERHADFDPRIGRRIREAAFEAISRSQTRMVILGRMSAIEKVGAFLIEMAERTGQGVPEGVVLSMSRYDIGDYLGLASETVSRTLSELRQAGAIRFEGMHRVRILDSKALEEGQANGGGIPAGERCRGPSAVGVPSHDGAMRAWQQQGQSPPSASRATFQKMMSGNGVA
jgi:CRP/FNR family nitrogen fixation transcriptional regulator